MHIKYTFKKVIQVTAKLRQISLRLSISHGNLMLNIL